MIGNDASKDWWTDPRTTHRRVSRLVPAEKTGRIVLLVGGGALQHLLLGCVWQGG